MKYREAMLSAGQAYFYRVLSEAHGDITRAAQIAGLNRTTLYKILPKYGINIEKRAYVKQGEPNGKYPIKA